MAKFFGFLLIVCFLGITDCAYCQADIFPDEAVSVKQFETAGWLKGGTISSVSPETDYPLYKEGVFSSFAPSSRIRAMVTLNDTLWIGTEGGLFALDTLSDSLFAAQDFPFLSVRALAVDDYERLWVGCDEGVAFRNQTWNYYTRHTHPFFERIRDLTVGSRKIWISTYGNGCGYISGDSLTVFTEKDSLMDNRVLKIVEETASRIWFATASGICYADSFKWESMRYGNNIPIGSINDLAFDEGKNLFIAVCRQGVSRYKFGSVTNYTDRDGLPGWDINSFSLDLTGKLIAGGSEGLSYYDGSGWTRYRIPGIPLNKYNILSIHHDLSGRTYLGTDDGTIIILDRDSSRELRLRQGFPASRVSEIYGYKDLIYFVTCNGVFKLGEHLTRLSLPDNYYSESVTDIAVEDTGRMWITTRFGILRSSGDSWKIFDRRSGLPTEYFTSVAADSGKGVWFGTFESGVLNFNGGKWYHYTVENGLPGNAIKDIIFDRSGKPWVITAAGETACYSDSGWQRFGPGTGKAVFRGGINKDITILNDPDIYLLSGSGGRTFSSGGGCLGRDNSGNVVIAGDDGIYFNYRGKWSRIDLPQTGYKISPSALIETERSDLWLGTKENGIFILSGNKWRHLKVLSGFSGKGVLSLHEDPSGRIWIGTRGKGAGRFIYFPDAENKKPN
ncbi:MAG: two-component regulator propeller domain-containing protein [Candidatus Krumholzibacteriota bacterium]|nr:two-component regulator propeller domain-containing protein [Candidatus Krumholzibacteriota bacterium]